MPVGRTTDVHARMPAANIGIPAFAWSLLSVCSTCRTKRGSSLTGVLYRNTGGRSGLHRSNPEGKGSSCVNFMGVAQVQVQAMSCSQVQRLVSPTSRALYKLSSGTVPECVLGTTGAARGSGDSEGAHHCANAVPAGRRRGDDVVDGHACGAQLRRHRGVLLVVLRLLERKPVAVHLVACGRRTVVAAGSLGFPSVSTERV